MRETSRRAQLALEWRGAVQWDELPTAAQVEIRALLGALLRGAAYGDDQAESTPDE